MNLRSERGIAMVVALFMVLITSVIGASLMSVAQTETLSTQNYRMMSQARYAAESGVHHAANFLLNTGTYNPPTAGGADDLANYDMTTSPVRRKSNNEPVILSSIPAVKESNYPSDTVKDLFAATAKGVFDVGDAKVNYGAYAVLRSMRRFTDAFTNQDVTLQTWEIFGEGDIQGAKSAIVEVSSTVERQTSPLYGYAAFATHNGCGALSFAGGAKTNSYDSKDLDLVGGKPTLENSWGNVGTNGNLTEVGNPTVVNGSLSTPRTGVGTCTTNNITAYTGAFDALTGGINKLSQSVTYPTPPAIDPPPPTTSYSLNSDGCSGITGAACVVSGGLMTITPSGSTPVRLGNVSMNAGITVTLKPGNYEFNSLTQNGNAKLVIENDPAADPVVIKIAGEGVTTALKINGGGVENETYDPQKLKFVYGGDKDVILAGGEKTSALFYAPNANAKFSGGSDVYGAVVVKYLTETGGAEIHYDRRLQNSGLMAGNHMMSAFTWKTY